MLSKGKRNLPGPTHVMSCQFKITYLICFIVTHFYHRITTIFNVKFKINNIAFTIKDSFEGQSAWDMNLITPLSYVINICIFYGVCFEWQCYLVKDLVAYNQANFHHPVTFRWRNITIYLRHECQKIFPACIRLCDKFVYILCCVFWTTMSSCKGSCSVQSRTSYDI